MTHMDGKGMNILEENIKCLKELFPEIVTEGKVDFDMLRQVLGDYVEEDEYPYTFTWSGKGNAFQLSESSSTGTLRPAQSESKDWTTTKNLYIEGDNLEVLKSFQRSYFGRIKMIYIDPPYNTGNDFVYEDDFKDNISNYKRITGQVDEEGKSLTSNPETSGRYHRDWLNMIYPRLRLARNLLTEDGLIFISIDDNEQANLRKICDEVFGETNFISNFIWNSSTGGGIRAKHVNISHQHIVCYAKSKDYLPSLYAPLSDEAVSSYKSEDEKGIYRDKDFAWRNSSTNPNQRYAIVAPDGETIIPKDGYILRFIRERFDKELSDGNVTFKKTTTGPFVQSNGAQANWNIYMKKYLGDSTGAPISVLPRSLVGLNNDGTTEVQSIFGARVFDFPKSTRLLNYLLQIGSDEDSIILDFFSGSATTAHAVMQLNANECASRQYIMVQLPEATDVQSEAYKAGFKNICEIGKERIRRAGELVRKQAIEAWNAADMEQRQQMRNPDELDIGFKVFKLDSTNLIKWNPDRENLEASLLGYVDNLEPGRTEEDLLYEVMLKLGADLTWPIEAHKVGTQTIYSVGFGALMVCLSDRITTEVAEAMARLKEQLKPETWKVVFKDSGFADDMAKTNIKETLKYAGLPEDAFTTL